jgi:hypothetical protein
MPAQLRFASRKGEAADQDAVAEERLVFAEVYAPDRPDSDQEFMRAEDIKQMAYNFMRKSEMGLIDVNHDNQVVEGCTVVESFIARKGDPDFIEGSWVVGVHIPDDTVWEQVKKGEINGFSLQALVEGDVEMVEVDIPDQITGMTSKTEGHYHRYIVQYDAQGRFRGGTTSPGDDGHVHQIKRGTFTEKAEDGHTHRFVTVDAVEILSGAD